MKGIRTENQPLSIQNRRVILAATGAAILFFLVTMFGGFSTREAMSLIPFNQTPYEPEPVPTTFGQDLETGYTPDLSLEDLAFESHLIVQGTVIDQKKGRPEPGWIPTTSNILQVEEVTKGDPNLVGKQINIVTEGPLNKKESRIVVNETAELKKGENVKLFLYPRRVQVPDDYGVHGGDQGKYKLDPAGRVTGKFVKDVPADVFDAKIKDILSKPRPQEEYKNEKPGDRDMTTEEAKAFEEKNNRELGGPPPPFK